MLQASWSYVDLDGEAITLLLFLLVTLEAFALPCFGFVLLDGQRSAVPRLCMKVAIHINLIGVAHNYQHHVHALHVYVALPKISPMIRNHANLNRPLRSLVSGCYVAGRLCFG